MQNLSVLNYRVKQNDWTYTSVLVYQEHGKTFHLNLPKAEALVCEGKERKENNRPAISPFQVEHGLVLSHPLNTASMSGFRKPWQRETEYEDLGTNKPMVNVQLR